MLRKLFSNLYFRYFAIAGVFLTILAFGGGWSFNVLAPKIFAPDPANNLPAVIAHRGASLCAPENTLAAFQIALDLGADGIEMDVHLSRDNVPVVVHPHNLSRRYERPVFIDEMTYEEIKTLDVGSWFSDAYKGERIPTLAAALKLLAGKTKVVYLHDKRKTKKSRNKTGRTKIFAATIRQSGLKNRVVVMANTEELSVWRAVAPDINVLRTWAGRHWQTNRFPTGELTGKDINNVGIYHTWSQYRFGNILRRIKNLSIVNVFQYLMFWPNEEFLSGFQEKGTKFVVFTINNTDLMRLYTNVGIDAIGTDNPSLLRFILNGEKGRFSGPCAPLN